MNDKILAALLQLDTGNDEHWTSDGLPRMDAVEAIVGDRGITRQQVTAAKPGFSRAVALIQASQGEGGTATPAQPPQTAPAQAQPPQTAQPPAAPSVQDDESGEGEVDDSDDADISGTEAALAEAKAQLQELAEAKAKATEAHAAKSLEVDALTDALIQEKGQETTTTAIQAYLARQRQNLEQRAAKMKTIRESGIDLKTLQRDLSSPLDAALKGRR